MLLKLRNFPRKENAIIVVETTGEAGRIAWLLVKSVTNVVERTTLCPYANQRSLDPREDQTDQMIGHEGSRVNVPTDAKYMMWNAVMTAPEMIMVQPRRIWWTRSRFYFIIENIWWTQG